MNKLPPVYLLVTASFLAMATLSHAQVAGWPSLPQGETEATAPSSKVWPLPEEILEPGERLIFSDLYSKLEHIEGSAEALVVLDNALTKLRQPTKLRGMVQNYRAGILLYMDKFQAAIDAVDESIRLLPGYSGPLITAASTYA